LDAISPGGSAEKTYLRNLISTIIAVTNAEMMIKTNSLVNEQQRAGHAVGAAEVAVAAVGIGAAAAAGDEVAAAAPAGGGVVAAGRRASATGGTAAAVADAVTMAQLAALDEADGDDLGAERKNDDDLNHIANYFSPGDSVDDTYDNTHSNNSSLQNGDA
jgi:hypothetical protein